MTRVDDAFKTQGLSGLPSHAYLGPMIEAFVASGAADTNYLDELNGDAGQFWSRVWEAMLYTRFNDQGWTVSGAGAGPDFSVEATNGPVLVEATVPAPEGLPANQLVFTPGVHDGAHKEILLRWTAKLADKRAKHEEHISKKLADPALPFVIAINSCRLGWAPEENGISQWPYAVEATFPIGPLAVPIDPETHEMGEAFQSLRFSVPKKPGVDIPTGNFLDPTYAVVSALIGCAQCYSDEATAGKFVGQPPYFLVHNPLATNPLPRGWLPGAIEYAAEQTDEETFVLSRLTPRDDEIEAQEPGQDEGNPISS